MVLVLLLATAPLLWPTVPPLTDLPGHLGRYRVELDGGATPGLAAWYSFDWSLMGNLGIDLLVLPLAPLFGLELAVKLILIAAAAMAAVGVLWVSREAHGRVQPTALVSLPFFFGFPFTFGFANFILSMALALLAFGLWLMLDRKRKLRLRAVLFVPLAMALWLVHAYGWGVLGLMVFASEFASRNRRGEGLVGGAVRAALSCLPLIPPVLLMLLWRSGDVAGNTEDFFSLKKGMWVAMALRDRWMVWDLLCVAAPSALILWAMFSRRFTWSPRLLGGAIGLSVIYVLMPGLLMGSGYADMRLAPFLFLFWLLALRITDESGRLGHRVAIGAAIFYCSRMALQTASFFLYAQEWEGRLAALDRVPQEARLVTFVGHACRQPWLLPRTEHLPGLALERRRAFANDQWQIAGSQLLRVHHPAAGSFAAEPSHIVLEPSCTIYKDSYRSIDSALANFPRDAFDYVWLVDPPPYDPRGVQGLKQIWKSADSILFAVEHPLRAAEADPARPTDEQR